MLASWNGNRQIGLYVDEVKELRGERDIGYFLIDLVGNFLGHFLINILVGNFSKCLYLLRIFFNKFWLEIFLSIHLGLFLIKILFKKLIYTQIFNCIIYDKI
jgi:hypothetical protein